MSKIPEWVLKLKAEMEAQGNECIIDDSKEPIDIKIRPKKGQDNA